ncbi:chromosome partitioning protein ParA [Comamonas testosteroni]|uniref:chromosome partitioning protein ParA n=1 Tax=Comamonas testosteroni TaxID=285 RepID=UPI0015F96175|nr:chromosome partitioning protein ParA [Comamonas testosteroni]
MNKIIVVGHPQSGFERVEELLLDCGMAEAKPSRREGLTPAQISETLLKVHGATPVQKLSAVGPLKQIEVTPLWNGLALDLMLANMEQSLWGWSDTQAVYLLDYWRFQDPQTVFVLVFDEPQSILTRQTLDQADANPEELEARINAWIAYNSALLNFHLRYPERSMLVHAAQVQRSAQSYLQQVSARIDAPLQVPGVEAEYGKVAEITNSSEEARVLEEQAQQTVGEADIDRQIETVVESSSVIAIELEGDSETMVCNIESKQGLDGNALAQWLVQQLLQGYPQASELYEQLQAAASLPQRSGNSKGNSSLECIQTERNHSAWSAFVAQQATLQERALRITQLGKTLDEQVLQMQQLDLQLAQLKEAQAAAQQQTKVQQRLLTNHETQLQESGQENQLLLEQLHRVQEELESRYMKAQQHEKLLAELPKLKADLKASQEKSTALQNVSREKQALQEQLQKVQQELASRKTLAQQHEKLLAEQAKVKAELKAAQDKATQLQSSEVKLKKELETERAKAPVVELQKENELLLGQLHKVQEELERYYLENAQYKAASKPKAYYGAVDRVKQDLPYRLGATMIQRSGSLSGLLFMPWALRAEADRIRAEQTASPEQLPSIAEYRDAHEAAQVKRHLSYRLGETWVQRTQTLGGWVTLPGALYAQVRAFRKERHKSR